MLPLAENYGSQVSTMNDERKWLLSGCGESSRNPSAFPTLRIQNDNFGYQNHSSSEDTENEGMLMCSSYEPGSTNSVVMNYGGEFSRQSVADERRSDYLETCSLPNAALIPHSTATEDRTEMFPGSSVSSDGAFRDIRHNRKMRKNWNQKRLSIVDRTGCGRMRPYVSSVFRPLVKQTSVGLDRQFSEPQRVKQQKELQKYGTIAEEQSSSQTNVVKNENESDVESTSSSSSKSSSWFSTKQSVTVCTMAVANLCSMIAFSCIAPFYPAEAKEKGLTDSEIGIIFGVFELVVCIASLVLGKYMVYIGSKRMLVSGLMITGVAAILFGFLMYLPSGSIFFLGSISVRVVEAIGDACFVTASFVISVKCFPAHISTVIGTLETFAGFGFTAGPMIGAALYDLGGFELPFLVLGAILLLVSLMSCYLIENYRDEPSGEKKGMLGMLKVPVVWVILSAVVIYALSTAFLDPTLAEHLASFKLSTTIVGLMFLLDAGIYTVTAPIWGLIYDKWHCAFIIMVFGATVSAIAMFIIGPSPFLNMQKQLAVIAISLCVLGVASGAFYIPTFQKCLEAVRAHGYEDSFETYAGVSGIFQSAFAFGSFVGPTVGGISVEWIGFAWTSTAIGFIFILLTVFLVCTTLSAMWKRESRSC